MADELPDVVGVLPHDSAVQPTGWVRAGQTATCSLGITTMNEDEQRHRKEEEDARRDPADHEAPDCPTLPSFRPSGLPRLRWPSVSTAAETRSALVEDLISRFPDTPPEAVLKEDLLRTGIALTSLR